MVAVPKPPASSTPISPPGSVLASAPAKVRHGAARVHGLESLPSAAETQVCDDGDPPPELDEKVAATLAAEFIVTAQPPLPLQAPVQPLKVAPAAGVSSSVTCVPPEKFALHVDPQSMPDGELVTAPLPVTLTERL